LKDNNQDLQDLVHLLNCIVPKEALRGCHQDYTPASTAIVLV